MINEATYWERILDSANVMECELDKARKEVEELKQRIAELEKENADLRVHLPE